MSKRVYLFNEGSADMRNLLGGKGANLAEMTNIGLPIPNGFTISTEACTDYYNDGKTINEDTQAQIFKALEWLEGVQGKKFGDTENPLQSSTSDSMMFLSRALQLRQAMPDLPMIPTEDSSKCSLTSLWA